ncbi:YdeI/OmpD-associated family protein [Streptomyces cylindrosporus]|uniref:YdeI/OmpD-associated family protein n=1 Tax=Streptomyces cylindrosporus TaxID=2927583 RepID=A0ABS9Y9Z9_9ACTN|nr:YdeI/OmpD-associated family protein [Streptomyces cylindrosporus]MCI3273340.1 YdeI/OmpD-associated family protein [Streptomyces cylindrosporus]
MTSHDALQAQPFPTAPDLDAWLTAHPAPHPGLWVKVAKKGSGIVSVGWGEVNDVALCHGWITGQRKALDASYYLQKITPRRRGSVWSMVNVRRVAELTEEGRMRPAGLAEVAAAQADGRWAAAYAPQAEAVVPPDLAAALERDPQAGAAFDALGRTGRYQVIHGLLTARTDRGRAARLAAALARLSRPASPARTSADR